MSFKGGYEGGMAPAMEGAFPAPAGGASFGFESVGTGVLVYGTSLSINMPDGLESGDGMLMFVTKDGSTLPTTPSGWTVVHQRASGSFSHCCYKKEADASDAAASTLSVALNSTEDAVGSIVRVPNGDITTVDFREAATGSTSPVSRSLPSTSVAEGMLIIGFCGHENPECAFSQTPATANSHTEQLDLQSQTGASTAFVGQELYSKIAPTTNVVEYVNFTKTDGGTMSYGLLKINEK